LWNIYTKMLPEEWEETQAKLVNQLYREHPGYPKRDEDLTMHQSWVIGIPPDPTTMTMCDLKQYSRPQKVATPEVDLSLTLAKNQGGIFTIICDAPPHWSQGENWSTTNKNLRFEEQESLNDPNQLPSISSILRSHPVSFVPGTGEL
jgi:hypothetical protein